ncbi:MAG: glycosyltransferase family 8 protein [Anaeroplasmataceae bacterium]|nr:glycosyltransferase family 8 protein [Anaeroplasmataceae bacterium]
MEDVGEKIRCIIVSINEKYVAFFSVLLKSIVESTNDNKKYEIVVLHAELRDKNKKILEGIAYGKNVCLRFLNVSKRVKGHSFFVNGENEKAYLSREAYFRLMAPELLPEYERALYLDSDIIVLPGWTDIFTIDLDEYLLAAVPDIWDNWKCYSAHSDLAKYREKELSITDNMGYFNSGMMLLNLKAMRNTFKEGELLGIATTKKWRKHDQDVINMMCKGKVHLLDYKWNLIECPSKKAFTAISKEEACSFQESQNDRKIVHFASRKPWKVRGVLNENDFWKYAVRSPYFDILFSLFIEEQMQQGKYFEQIVFKSIKRGKIGVSFIGKCIIAWTRKMLRQV